MLGDLFKDIWVFFAVTPSSREMLSDEDTDL